MNYVLHSGIKGQKWGVRRYQNPDGSLTAAGKLRYYGQKIKKAYEDMPEEDKQRIHDTTKTVIKTSATMYIAPKLIRTALIGVGGIALYKYASNNKESIEAGLSSAKDEVSRIITEIGELPIGKKYTIVR